MGNYCRITRALYVTHSQNTCFKYKRGAALEKPLPLTVGVLLLAAFIYVAFKVCRTAYRLEM